MATRLKSIRESLEPKESQEDMARRADITLATYRSAENGRNCTYTTAVAILEALNAALAERGQAPVTLDQLGLRIV
jgi:DNA-binding XRE family transcriptional regulator